MSVTQTAVHAVRPADAPSLQDHYKVLNRQLQAALIHARRESRREDASPAAATRRWTDRPRLSLSSQMACSGVRRMSRAERLSSSSASVRGPISGTTGKSCAST